MKSFGGRVRSGALFSIALLVFIGLALDLVSPAAARLLLGWASGEASCEADTKSSMAARYYRPFCASINVFLAA
jgi:hypothetical protein